MMQLKRMCKDLMMTNLMKYDVIVRMCEDLMITNLMLNDAI